MAGLSVMDYRDPSGKKFTEHFKLPNEPTDTLLEFPCDFPVKVMGKFTADFEAMVREIAERHVGKLPAEAISSRPSSNQRFVAVTIVVRAKSKQQLDNLYLELTSTKQVLMAL